MEAPSMENGELAIAGSLAAGCIPGVLGDASLGQVGQQAKRWTSSSSEDVGSEELWLLRSNRY
eukprot:12892384-Prorocentrum_lima.AAC.1